MRRSHEELAAWRARCPIERARVELRRGGISDEALGRVEAHVRSVVDEAVRSAKEAAEPPAMDLFSHVGARMQA